MDIFTLLLFVFIIISVVVLYLYNIQIKSENLDSFEDKVCPKCKSVNVTSKKLSSNCCGVNEYLFECGTCGYKQSYSISQSYSCDINCSKQDEIYSTQVEEKSIKV